jgi:hypothetical protein
METNLKGRLRNTPLPFTNGLLPMFEAVVNSIHAIEEAKLSSEKGKITVEIIRQTQQGHLVMNDPLKKKMADALEDVIGFKVTDNGIGFNDANMRSFRTLDTDYKADKGCRGIGRLLWLKVFSGVKVESIFEDEERKLKTRKFIFNAASGIANEENSNAPLGSERSTSIHLNEFEKKYRDYARKTLKAIADNLFEHCLWYYVRSGGAPKITVWDDGESIDLDSIYHEHMHTSAMHETISLKEQKFDLLHIKLRASMLSSHAVAFCADNRLVTEERLSGKVPGLYGKLADGNGEFWYVCYVSSEFLNNSVRPERTSFNILESVGELLSNTEISFNEIRQLVNNRAEDHLREYLAVNKKRAKERVDNYVSKKAPRYRPILSRIPEDKLNIDPEISDKDLDITLHKYLSEIESQLLSDGHDIMAPQIGEGTAEYQKRLQDYLKTAEDIKKSDLANYIFHRRVILDILEKAIQRGSDGKYAREDLIHSLIMPMRTESREVILDSCNLWLVDERLAFHDYLASDKPLSSIPITGSSDTKEPDICSLNVFDNSILVSEGTKLPLASIVVIEIKRPMRNDAASGEDYDPIEQALGYLERIRAGGVQTKNGRPIPKSEDIPGFCYIICDITSSIEKRCKVHDLIRSKDGLGYFKYKDSYKAYVEVISFERLVNDAKERNRAFFDKLGLPTV